MIILQRSYQQGGGLGVGLLGAEAEEGVRHVG